MITTLMFLAQLLNPSNNVPSPMAVNVAGITIGTDSSSLDDSLDAHKNARVRCQAGLVEHSGLQLSTADWSFADMNWLETSSASANNGPFADNYSNPFND
jgi:hypothetical protein